MRALPKLLAGLIVLFGWTACGDSLELGNRGSEDPGGFGGSQSIGQCPVSPDRAMPNCSACDAVGTTCDAPNNVTCCCGLGVETGAAASWSCFTNAACCPAQAPELGTPCDCIDFACKYCGERSTNSFVCGADGLWQASNVSSGC